MTVSPGSAAEVVVYFGPLRGASRGVAMVAKRGCACEQEEAEEEEEPTPLLTRDSCCLAVSQSVKSENEENKNNTRSKWTEPEPWW